MQRLAAWVTLLLLLGASACSGEAVPIGDDPVPTTGRPITTRRPTTTGPDAPPGLLLQVRNSGSYWDSFQTVFATVPSVTLYADGVVIRRGPQDASHPGPALPPLLTGTIGDDAVRSATTAARDAGLARDPDLGEPTITDQSTTKFTFVEEGRTHRVSAYALDMDDLLGLSSEQKDNRRRLIDLQRRLGDLTTTAVEPYRASVISVLVLKPGEGGSPAAPAGGEADWPLGDLSGGGVPKLGGRCLGFTGPDAGRVLAAAGGATTNTRWRSGGTTWSLAFRPELPGDSPCTQITVPP